MHAWTGEAAVATVYAGDTFAQIILDSSPNATTRSSNTSLITLEQQTMIWTLYQNSITTHLPIVQENCEPSAKPYHVPLLYSWATVTVPATSVTIGMAPYDPAFDDATGAISYECRTRRL